MDRPISLATLVDIQPGAIVSRVLLKADGGSLTLFAFDAGQALSEHSTPHEAVVTVLEGRVRILIGGKGFEVDQGETLHLPATVPHALEALSPLKMLLTMFRTGRREAP